MLPITTPPGIELIIIREAIGQAESAGDYTAQSAKSSASGKYQYISRTWGNYGGFSRAAYAPAYIQDERMMRDLAMRMHRYGGDVEKVIAAHFYPAWAGDKSLWDASPVPGSITIRQYVDRVMGFTRRA